MALSFPIVAPSSPKPSSIVLSFANVIGVGISPYTLKTQVTDYGGTGWGLDVGFDPIYRSEAAPWIAFLASLRGQFGTFLMGIESMSQPLGVAGGTPRVKGASQNGFTLESDGWPNSSEVLKAGDLFEIDQRLYMAVKNTDSDGSGNASIECWPALKNHADNSLILTDNPVGTWRLTGNVVRGVDVPNTELYTISFSAQEAI